jgi:hypothetical protein
MGEINRVMITGTGMALVGVEMIGELLMDLLVVGVILVIFVIQVFAEKGFIIEMEGITWNRIIHVI